MINSICPDCIEPLVKNRKQLGDLTQWLICPKCGFRIREASILFTNETEINNFEAEIDRVNEGNYYIDIYNQENYHDSYILKR